MMGISNPPGSRDPNSPAGAADPTGAAADPTGAAGSASVAVDPISAAANPTGAADPASAAGPTDIPASAQAAASAYLQNRYGIRAVFTGAERLPLWVDRHRLVLFGHPADRPELALTVDYDLARSAVVDAGLPDFGSEGERGGRGSPFSAEKGMV
ncbi:hypothetical protein [Gorillibacterium sp. sgz500922]|uniref:hypothetical protein n=1 Tax=Gorillibacterium sp. sgz500922 TaxID=3446694 RepID=UPI003F6635E2